MSSSFQYQLLLILKNIFELAANAVNKNLVIFKVFLKENFKLDLCYWVFGFDITFILMPLLNYCSAKLKDNKKNLVRPLTPIVLK